MANDYIVKPVEKAIQVLQCVGAAPSAMALKEISSRVGMPKTTVFRYLRTLHAAGLITPEPRKRPRSSWIRFEASAPNEVWQSDFTHWRLADGSEVEIISWLDDHSRSLLACTAFRRVGGDAGAPCATQQLRGSPRTPWRSSPVPTGYLGRQCRPAPAAAATPPIQPSTGVG